MRVVIFYTQHTEQAFENSIGKPEREFYTQSYTQKKPICITGVGAPQQIDFFNYIHTNSYRLASDMNLERRTASMVI